MKEEVSVRFAPSPTGIPHVGNIRTALFDYFFARSNGGKFILRIEDTDQARKVENAEDTIKESLSWLGVEWDEYARQSERLEEYKKAADKLVEKGLARKEDGAIRFIVSKSETVSWTDAVGNKEIVFNTQDIEDFIILKKDGFPTYHLANVVDDHTMGITHVIRGEDWIPSTPKHLLLYKAFGWNPPIFAHVPNVLGPEGKKLSKRTGAKSVLEYKEEGYLADAVLNYLMLLGWAPKNDRELLTKEEIIQEFSFARVHTNPALFDPRKLAWMNGEYIRAAENTKLKKQILELNSQNFPDLSDTMFDKFLEIAKSRMKTLVEFEPLVRPFVEKQSVTLRSEQEEDKQELRNRLESVKEWKQVSILEALLAFLKEKNQRFPYIYEIVIGQKQGLPLADTFEVLGKDKTLHLLS